MENPNKYKSIPVTNVFNRTIMPANSTKKANVQLIVQKFIQYLKNKHL